MALGFWNIGREDPDRVAVVTPDGDQVTFGELLARNNQVGHGLRALGLEVGDTIATVLPNGMPMLELYLACFDTGLYITPVNHHLVGPEIAYIVDDCEAKAVIVHERFTDEVRRAAEEFSVPEQARFAVGEVDGFRPYAELTEGQPDTQPEGRTAGAAMHYTSGTTGRPKGVKRPLNGLDPDIAGELFTGFPQMFGITPQGDGVHITGSPLYHTAVLHFTANSLHMGHKVVLMDKWTPEGMLELIERERVTHSHMVPTQFHRLLALPEEVRDRYDVSSLSNMVHAAAPCPVDTKRRMFDWWGPVIYEYYAATEGGGTTVTPEQWLAKPGTVGTAWSTSTVAIFDEEGNELGPGEIGTVYMRMDGQDFEYKDDPDKTQANRLKGFFTVGDVGELDEDGFLFLRDRKSDMIISGGVNIYPAEIEGALMQHPKVSDVAVFGIPNDDWGEEIKAVIEPTDGVDGDDDLVDELLDYCADNLAKLKHPRSIDFIDEMPRDPNGKLYKRKLRDPYWEGADRAI
jgi:long-chain acyl-CoA synthetase